VQLLTTVGMRQSAAQRPPSAATGTMKKASADENTSL